MTRAPGFTSILALFMVLATIVPTEPVSAQSVPAITRPVVDPSGYLSANDTEAIASELVALRDKTGVQMAVLVIKTTEGVPIEDFANVAFDTWGGGSKERNDGVLFVLAVDDRRNRLEVGRGLEALITDAKAVGILESIKPRLREADYGVACRLVVAGVADLVGHLTPDAAITTPEGPLELDSHGLVLLFGVPWLLGVFSLLLSQKKKSDSPSKAWRHRLARLPTWSKRRRLLALFVLGPLLAVFPFLISDGMHFYGAYLFSWFVCAGLGIFGGIAVRKGMARAITFGVFILAGLVFLLLAPAEPILSGLDLLSSAVATAFIMVLLTTFFVADGEGGSGSGSSWSSSSGSSSGSSSSSWSSSSSSSSSWSGGGGSSGGGGASSSW